MGAFLSSKKAWGLILGAVALMFGAYFQAHDAYYIACGVIFGAHQAAQGMQDTAIARKEVARV